MTNSERAERIEQAAKAFFDEFSTWSDIWEDAPEQRLIDIRDALRAALAEKGEGEFAKGFSAGYWAGFMAGVDAAAEEAEAKTWVAPPLASRIRALRPKGNP